MWSLGQLTCMVTVALLPWPGTVTLQEVGGTAQSRGGCLLLERFHLLSSDPDGGSECPLHQLAWSQALLAGELEAENLSFPVRLSDTGSLHCLCGVWLVKETPTVSCEVEVRVLLGARFYQ